MVHFSKGSRHQHQFFWGGGGKGGVGGALMNGEISRTRSREKREKSYITTIKKTKRRLLCTQARSICLFVFSTYYISVNTKLTRTPFLAHKEIFWILYGFFYFT